KVADENQSENAIMAIENTIAGSLLHNYQLLNQSDLHIVGEVFLRIQQNLMVLQGVKIEDLTEVYSHPVAIAQCRKFFKQYPHIKLIEAEDTAMSAKMVQEKQYTHVGAIASTLAAELYDLEIIGRSIETFKKNYTRFLILDRAKSLATNTFDKVSLCFTLPHEVGSLHQVLATLALCKANLTKIQSAPLLDSEFEYLFFVDFLLEKNEDLASIMNLIKKHTLHLRVLGKYKKGEKHEH
ncbi:MAG TPA: prephenate dehydratase, partial [Phaeodactylibacter sp.]|nr:prephenate dehydratase [Phaeodactylibacter sp.]